jgi:hypothetical protein
MIAWSSLYPVAYKAIRLATVAGINHSIWPKGISRLLEEGMKGIE